jgi:hypothetical protein
MKKSYRTKPAPATPSDTADTKAPVAGDSQASDPDAQLKKLCVDAAARYAASASTGGAPTTSAVPAVWVSVARMAAAVCVVVQVAVGSLAAYLNDLGQQTKRANIADVQVCLQKRRGKRDADETEIWGVIVDVDVEVDDALAAHIEAGNPMPTCVWRTEHGFKGAWAFDRAVDKATFERIAKQFTLAVPGGDPRSWSVAQLQRLPSCWKSCPDGVRDVDFPAVQTNPVPLQVAAAWTTTLPKLVARAITGTLTLTPGERTIVEDYLVEIGIPAPDEPGHALYSACPLKADHSSKSCFVNRREDGSIHVHCLSGHGGEGAKDWNEHSLFALATGRALPEGHIDPVRDIPVTWAGEALVRHKLRAEFSASHDIDQRVQAGAELWQLARAEYDVARWLRAAAKHGLKIAIEATTEQFLDVYAERLRGIDRAGPFRPYYDEGQQGLRLILTRGSSVAVRTKGDTLTERAHLHEWCATAIHTIVVAIASEDGGKVIVAEPGFERAGHSIWNKALAGYPACLVVLGLARLRVYELPIAFVQDDWSVESKTKLLTGVRVVRIDGDASFDTVQFFIGLFQQGRLPVMTDADVRRLVMALASPLLRHIAPGLLGVYWLIGPPGAGKDLLAELLGDIWRVAAGGRVKVKFDVSITDDLEHKRSFFAAGSAVYGRIKEAGKRVGMIDQIIRFAGTDQVPARGMCLDEIEVPNTFTYIADSAEDLPDRREISRRTVVINVSAVDDKVVSLGDLRADVLAHAVDIIANLKAIVETKSPEWFLNRKNTGARPVIPVALAELFDVELPQVVGRNLEDLFDAMWDYISTKACGTEGQEQQQKARDKDGKEVKAFANYRLSHLVETMRTKIGVQGLFKDFGTPRSIVLALQREADYGRHKLPYLRVEVHGTPHAFKLVKDRRNFVFEPELTFCNTLGIQPLGPACPSGGTTTAAGGSAATSPGSSAPSPAPSGAGCPASADDPDAGTGAAAFNSAGPCRISIASLLGADDGKS